MNCSTPGLPVHHQLPSSLRLTSIGSVMPSSHLILCRPLLLLPPIPASIRVFSNDSTLRMRWPKYCSFSFSISSSYFSLTLSGGRGDCLPHLPQKKTSFSVGLSSFPACTPSLGHSGSHCIYSPDANPPHFHTGRGPTILGSPLMSSNTLMTFWPPHHTVA